MRKLLATLLLVFAGIRAEAAVSQRPLHPITGLSPGVGYGTTFPTDPHDGELYMLQDSSSEWTLYVYDGSDAAWEQVNNTSILAGNNTWTGLNTFARTAAGDDACFGAGTSQICIDGGTQRIRWDNAGFGVITLVNDRASSPFLSLTDDFQVSVPAGGVLQFTNLGVEFFINMRPAAGTSGDVFSTTATLTAMNGSDTVNIHDTTLTNANHTGVSNLLNFLNIPAITGDADATENAISIGTGWDFHLRLDHVGGMGGIQFAESGTARSTLYTENQVMTFNAASSEGFLFVSGSTNENSFTFSPGANAAAASADWFEMTIPTPGVLNGSDTLNFLNFTGFTDANHTGMSNVITAVNVGAITSPDADANHVAFTAGAGWDVSYQAANRRVDNVQSVTCVDDAGTGGALGGVTVTPTASYIEVTNNDAQGCEILFSETGAFEGQIFDLVIIVDAGTDTSTIPDSAGIFNGTGAVTLDAEDAIRVRYTGTIFVQVSLSNN